MKSTIIHGMFQDDYDYKRMVENQAKSTIEKVKGDIKNQPKVKTKIKTKISRKKI